MKSMVDISHEFLKPVLHKQAICIDATLGQGKDTQFFLSCHVGKVYGFEIQKEVYEEASQKFKDNENVHLFCTGHENMNDFIHEAVDAILFNFGYFPNGNTQITTQSSTSILAIQQALSLLKIKGRMALVLYPHQEGKLESQEIETFLKEQENLQIYKIDNFLVEKCPYVLMVEKRR